jgi:DNA-binding Xre family transcriptional regulator
MDEIASFTDKYGDERVIHKTRHGLKLKRQHVTPILALNPVVSGLIGERVRMLRIERGWELAELAHRIGVRGGHPKNRMWEIERGVRGEGIRLGTLYALAMALGVEITALVPSVEEVAALAGVQEIQAPTLVRL